MYKKYRRRTMALLIVFAIIFVCLSSVAITRLLKNGRLGVDLNIYLENIEPANQKEDVKIFIDSLNGKLKNNSLNLTAGHHSIEELDTNEMEYTPDVGWVYVEDKQITNYVFYFFDTEKIDNDNLEENIFYKNCYVQNIDNDLQYVDLGDMNTYVNVKDYGALGDGVTLDTGAIRKAVDVVNERGGLLYFPYGEYLVDPDGDYIKSKFTLGMILKITSSYPVIIDLCNSTIKQISYSYPNNYPNVRIFQFLNAVDIEIKNGTIIGDRSTHDYTSNDSFSQGGTSHGFGHGISLKDTRNALVYNLNIKEMTGDGIGVGNSEKGNYITTIDNCDISYCRRQGITIVASDTTFIRNSYIHDIGDVNIFNASANQGCNPKSGIDIEPNSIKERVNLVALENTKILNCTGFGIIGNKKEEGEEQIKQADVHIKNCEIDIQSIDFATIENSILRYTHSQHYGVAGVALMYQTIKNCKIYQEKESGTYIGGCVVEDCSFEATNSLLVSLVIKSDSKLKNVDFKNYTNKKELKEGYADFGLLFGLGNVNIDNVNIYNCEIGFHGRLSQFKNCVIEDSSIWASTTGEVVFYKTTFINCKTGKVLADGSVKASFDSCKFYDSDTFINFDKNREFVCCYFEYDSLKFSKIEKINSQTNQVKTYEYSNFFNEKDALRSIFDACLIKINGEIESGENYSSREIFGTSIFRNNTTIILDNYNSDVELTIPLEQSKYQSLIDQTITQQRAEEYKSMQDGDAYVVYYNGNHSLN